MADPDPKDPPATGDPPQNDPPPKAEPATNDPPKDPPDPPKENEPLGEAGKRALEAERAQRKAERKRADEAEAELKKLRDAQLSDEERLKQEAADGKKAAADGRRALRQANLLLALQEKGIAHPKAAARLLDGVKFGDDQEPSNLDEAIAAAKAEFGDAMFAPPRRSAADINPGGGGGVGDGPKLSAAEQQMARRLGQTDEQYAYYRDNPDTQVPWKPAAAATT